MIILIDNYDSFAYNLYQLVGSQNPNIKVIRNDELTIEDIVKLKPDKIIISPGPGKPQDAGICPEVVKRFKGQVPILGVCLGHQVICEVFGATVSYAKVQMHGKQSEVRTVAYSPLFEGLEDKFLVARYHSLAALKETIKDELVITAVSEDDEIMAVQHKEYAIYGLQFHPESILTLQGEIIIRNFLTREERLR